MKYLLMIGLTVATLVVACTKREEAKDAYSVQNRACLVAYDDTAHQKSCLEYVRNRWTEAGAPPAAVNSGLAAPTITDGGSHE